MIQIFHILFIFKPFLFVIPFPVFPRSDSLPPRGGVLSRPSSPHLRGSGPHRTLHWHLVPKHEQLKNCNSWNCINGVRWDVICWVKNFLGSKKKNKALEKDRLILKTRISSPLPPLLKHHPLVRTSGGVLRAATGLTDLSAFDKWGVFFLVECLSGLLHRRFFFKKSRKKIGWRLFSHMNLQQEENIHRPKKLYINIKNIRKKQNMKHIKHKTYIKHKR